MRYIDRVIIHCSDSKWGNSIEIDQWHKENGWKGIGYHYTIPNGYISPEEYDPIMDGSVESGRPIQVVGAHCKGHNNNSIGVCLIGKSGQFTHNQYKSLVKLLRQLRGLYEDIKIVMHSDMDSEKENCPGIDPVALLEMMSDE